MTDGTRVDEFQSIDDAGDSSAEREATGEPLDIHKWNHTQNNRQPYATNSASISNGLVDLEGEKGVWDPEAEKMHPNTAGRNELTDAEAAQFGLDGLLDALERARGDCMPIVSHNHLDVELLKKRIMEL